VPATTAFGDVFNPSRGEVIARVPMSGPEATVAVAGAALVEGLADLNTRLQVPRLRECRGVERAKFESSVEKMAADALASGSPQNNPVVPTAGQIVRLYEEAW
jgi:alcohol dehydrogenase class IV